MGTHCSGMAEPGFGEARIIGIVPKLLCLPKALCLAHGEGAPVTRGHFDKSQGTSTSPKSSRVESAEATYVRRAAAR